MYVLLDGKHSFDTFVIRLFASSKTGSPVLKESLLQRYLLLVELTTRSVRELFSATFKFNKLWKIWNSEV